MITDIHRDSGSLSPGESGGLFTCDLTVNAENLTGTHLEIRGKVLNETLN
jgi:hypothetical protein